MLDDLKMIYLEELIKKSWHDPEALTGLGELARDLFTRGFEAVVVLKALAETDRENGIEDGIIERTAVALERVINRARGKSDV